MQQTNKSPRLNPQQEATFGFTAMAMSYTHSPTMYCGKIVNMPAHVNRSDGETIAIKGRNQMEHQRLEMSTLMMTFLEGITLCGKCYQ